jgi:hypothetical protein
MEAPSGRLRAVRRHGQSSSRARSGRSHRPRHGVVPSLLVTRRRRGKRRDLRALSARRFARDRRAGEP